MKNDQQNKGERNTSISNPDSTFNNQQPGQQLPLSEETVPNINLDEIATKEHHSESSKPSGENETLGTP